MSLMLLSACQMPLPNKTFQVKAVTPPADQTLVPQDVFYAAGMTDAVAQQKEDFQTRLLTLRNQASNGFHTLNSFHTLDFPDSSGCSNGCVFGMDVSLNWPAPSGYIGSNTLALGDSDLSSRINISGYSYSLGTVETGINANGQLIATKIVVGASAVGWAPRPGGVFERGLLGGGGIVLSSTDGLHFTYLESAPAYMEARDAKANPEDPGCGLSYILDGSVYAVSATVDLHPKSNTATLGFVYSGDLTGAQWDYRDWDPTTPPDTKTCRQVGLAGNGTATVSMEVAVSFVRTATLAIEPSPAELYDNSQTSDVTVTPSELGEAWEVRVKPPVEDCPQPKTAGTGVSTKTFPFNPATLADGVYVLTAYYTNPLFGASSSTTISTHLPFAVTADKSEFQPGDTILFDVKAPPCPGWELRVTGEDNEGDLYFQVIPGVGNRSVSVDVNFNTIPPGRRITKMSSTLVDDHGRSVPGPSLGEGPATTTSPTPTPGCPIGVICGGGGGSPNPNPSGGSPSPSPSASPQVTPTPPPNSPSPTVTPPNSPTPTPNGGGDCTEPGHRMVKVKGQKDEMCVYCPAEYFEYNEDPNVGCYTILNFKIEPTPSPDPSVPPVFSPRDQNGAFDQLNFITYSEQLASRYVKWDMQVKAETGTLVGNTNYDGGPNLKNQIGLTSLFFDGLISNRTYIGDGKYKLKLMPKSEQPSAIPGIFFIKVPGYQDLVGSRVFVNPSLVNGQLQQKQELDFEVDNSAPTIESLVITDSKQGNDIFSQASLYVQDDGAGIDVASLAQRIYLEKTAIEVDEDSLRLANAMDFWIAGQPAVPSGVIEILPTSVEKMTDKLIHITFEFSGRLGARYLNFYFTDRVGNEGSYAITKQNLG